MNLKLLTASFGMILLLSSIALAVPGTPNAFYGNVVVNGNPAPDGMTVTARINNVEVASTTTSEGRYGYPLGSFYVDDPNSIRSGQEIRFYINGVDTGQTSYFVNGEPTRLDLSANVEIETSAPSGGGGGGGGGSGLPITSTSSGSSGASTVLDDTACKERWVCTTWGECVNGVQTRACTDQNECGTNTGEPFTSQPCSTSTIEEQKEQTESQNQLLPTGFFLGVLTNQVALGIIALVVISIIVAVILLRRRGNMTSSLEYIKPYITSDNATQTSDNS